MPCRCALGARPITILPHQPSPVTTQWPRSQHQTGIFVATETLHCDKLQPQLATLLSRHQRPCRDTETSTSIVTSFISSIETPRSRHKRSGRDPTSAHSAVPLSRHQNLCRDTKKPQLPVALSGHQGSCRNPGAPVLALTLSRHRTPVATQGELTMSRPRILCRDRELQEAYCDSPLLDTPAHA